MLYWSKYIYHIVVLTEIYCRFTIINYTTKRFLSLKCVYIFLADPVQFIRFKYQRNNYVSMYLNKKVIFCSHYYSKTTEKTEPLCVKQSLIFFNTVCFKEPFVISNDLSTGWQRNLQVTDTKTGKLFLKINNYFNKPRNIRTCD